jgi:hypothetical protein
LSRWESLRQHVVPAPAFAGHFQTPSSSSAGSVHLLPPRSTTPKPSRFARLGLRQVVEQVAVDEAILMTHEIQKACWAARGTEPSKSKSDQPYGGAFGSSTNLPGQPSGKKQELRRPASVLSLGNTSRVQPSLKPIHAVLRQHYSPPVDGISRSVHVLPLEAQILSVLLTPFLSSDKGPKVDEERWLAIESFDLIIKGWHPKDEVRLKSKH